VPASVRTVNLAGEPLKRSLADAIHRSSVSLRLLDLYGPSEDTTYSTWAPVERQERRELMAAIRAAQRQAEWTRQSAFFARTGMKATPKVADKQPEDSD